MNLYGQQYEILKQKNLFLDEKNKLDAFKLGILSNKTSIENALRGISIPSFSIDNKELKSFFDVAISELQNVKAKLEALKIDIDEIGKNYSTKIDKSFWNTLKNECEREVAETIEETEMPNIQRCELLSKETGDISLRLIQIDKIKENLLAEQDEKIQLADKYVNVLKQMTQSRKDFVSRVLKETNVKIEIAPFGNKINFEQQLRTILERETSYESDIDHLVSLCFKDSNVENNIKNFKDVIFKIKRGETVDKISGHFKNFISKLNPAQLDEIELLMPEDEIKVKYSPTGNKKDFKSLSTASDGQKTTAILTFILSHGETPLILDQPEDDLDNKLIYELIVESLKKVKESRQLIIVTHNANIPVNADAECVISMNSTSEKIKVFKTGSVDSLDIQEEICTIMEGGKEAFQRRSERYKNLK